MLNKSKDHYAKFQEPLDAYQVAALEAGKPAWTGGQMPQDAVEEAARLMHEDGWQFDGYNDFGQEVYLPIEK